MIPFSKILIPIDFSERCLGAARFAIPLAERFHSEIILLHVEPRPEAYPDQGIDREIPPEKRLRDFLAAAFAHLDVKRILRVGPDVGQEIVRYARECGSDLIMMPTHGYGAFRRFFTGLDHRQGTARCQLPRMDRCPSSTGPTRRVDQPDDHPVCCR